jgi:elongation factor P--beta-lysine ligase
MTAQTQQNYDLDAIASAVGVKPERARLIISSLVENFHFDATNVPQNGMVAILSSIIAIQQTHSLSVSQAVEKYVKDLQSQQKKTGGKAEHAAGSMAETIDKMADNLAEQIAPKVVELAAEKLQDKVLEHFAQGFEFAKVTTCFNQVGMIIDAEIREVERADRFQLTGSENVLNYFALPEGK